jgi:hypothetical protein
MIFRVQFTIFLKWIFISGFFNLTEAVIFSNIVMWTCRVINCNFVEISLSWLIKLRLTFIIKFSSPSSSYIEINQINFYFLLTFNWTKYILTLILNFINLITSKDSEKRWRIESKRRSKKNQKFSCIPSILEFCADVHRSFA